MGRSDHRAEVREFLSSRRARITPAQAGLPTYGGKRRVQGLRREEVALLAGISAEYYIRFERGQAAGASAGVIDSVATALQLSDVEREHLEHLVDSLTTAGRPAAVRRRPARGSTEPETVRPAVQVLLDAITELPAFVFNRRLDIVAAIRLGRLLYGPMHDERGRANTARFLFLDARGGEFWPEWEKMADDVVAVLRAEAGRDPNHSALVELIGQLSTRSEEFRRRWAAHDVGEHQSGTKTLCHPVIGRITLPFETLYFADDADVHLMTYTPDPGSPAHDALRLLSSWGESAPPDGAGRGADGTSPREQPRSSPGGSDESGTTGH